MQKFRTVGADAKPLLCQQLPIQRDHFFRHDLKGLGAHHLVFRTEQDQTDQHIFTRSFLLPQIGMRRMRLLHHLIAFRDQCFRFIEQPQLAFLSQFPSEAASASFSCFI